MRKKFQDEFWGWIQESNWENSRLQNQRRKGKSVSFLRIALDIALDLEGWDWVTNTVGEEGEGEEEEVEEEVLQDDDDDGGEAGGQDRGGEGEGGAEDDE